MTGDRPRERVADDLENRLLAAFDLLLLPDRETLVGIAELLAAAHDRGH